MKQILQYSLFCAVVTSFLFNPTSTYAQVTVWIVDFEAAGGYTTSVAECTDGVGDYFTRTNGSDISATFTGVNGSFYFAAADLDAPGCPAAALPVTLTIDDKDISGFTSLSLKVFLAEDDASDAAEDWDAGDYVHIAYDIDNSGTFTEAIWLEGTSTFNTAPQIDTDFDGVGDGTIITDNFVEFTKTIAATGSLIDVKITFLLEAGDEDIAIDNIRIVGTGAACTAPTIDAKADALDATTICEGVGVELTANSSGGSNCTGSWEFAWYTGDGTGSTYYDGTDWNNAEGAANVYSSTYSTVSGVSPSATVVYKLKVRCSTATTCNNTDATGVTVTVNPAPTTSAITGTTPVCEAATGITYSVTNTAGSTYAWTVPSGASITAGAGTNSITVTWAATSGNIQVTETITATGCLGTPVTLAVTVNASTIFRSRVTGDWNVANTWDFSCDGSNWYTATRTPNNTDGTITILTGHVVTITASVAIDQTTIDTGGTLVYGDNAGSTLTINDGTGVDLSINGTFRDEGPNDVVW